MQRAAHLLHDPWHPVRPAVTGGVHQRSGRGHAAGMAFNRACADEAVEGRWSGLGGGKCSGIYDQVGVRESGWGMKELRTHHWAAASTAAIQCSTCLLTASSTPVPNLSSSPPSPASRVQGAADELCRCWDRPTAALRVEAYPPTTVLGRKCNADAAPGRRSAPAIRNSMPRATPGVYQTI